MPRISVLIPTHEHASTLPYAVASVQAQGVDDIEILICGDGIDDALRAVVIQLQSADPRIRFFDLPKAPRLGELNRDHVLRQARGEIVCYQGDDDLWLPGHIEAMAQALEDADFAGAMQVNVDPDDKVRAHYFDLERLEFVAPWLEWKPNDFGAWACNGFGAAFVAHRLEAYRRLPEGWRTTPPGLPADQTMWHKFLRQDWCRARFLRWPVALHFPAPDRRDWTPERRADELRRWSEIIAKPDYAVRIGRDVMVDLGNRLLRQSLDDRRQRQELEFKQDRLATLLEQEKAQRVAAEQGRIEAEQGRVQAERQRATADYWRAAAERGCIETAHQRDALLTSTSWRATAPMRAAIDWIHRLRFRRGA